MMTRWTQDFRLRLIAELAARNIPHRHCVTDPSWSDLAQRIAFLADMPDDFLEINISNFSDVIGWVEQEINT